MKRFWTAIALTAALVMGGLGWGAAPVAHAGEDWEGRAMISTPEPTETAKPGGNRKVSGR